MNFKFHNQNENIDCLFHFVIILYESGKHWKWIENAVQTRWNFSYEIKFFTKIFYIQVLNPLTILKMKQIENSSRRKMRVKLSKVLYAQILFGPRLKLTSDSVTIHYYFVFGHQYFRWIKISKQDKIKGQRWSTAGIQRKKFLIPLFWIIFKESMSIWAVYLNLW